MDGDRIQRKMDIDCGASVVCFPLQMVIPSLAFPTEPRMKGDSVLKLSVMRLEYFH